MKTTVDIPDSLLERARRQARKSGRPVRALIEEGLRLVLDAESRPRGYRLPDRAVGNARSSNPLDSLSWQDLRDEIYRGR
jgi:hypothetical protein